MKTLGICTVLAGALGCEEASDELPPPDTTVRMGFSAWPGWFPWQIALEEDLFAQSGAMVELVFYESYTESLTDLAEGKLDANTQTLNDTLLSVAGGDEQVIVLVNDNSHGNDQCIGAEGITSVMDLVGKTVAVEFGVVDHFLLLLALRRYEIDPEDVDIVKELTDVAAEKFAAGEYDAVCVFAPFTTTALQRAGSSVIVSSETFPGAIPDYLVVSEELARDHPGDVAALVDTWWSIREFMAEKPERAAEIIAARAGVSQADYATYERGTRFFTLEQNLEALGAPPAACNVLGADERLYTACVAFAIADFLLQDAALIDAPIGEAAIRASWTDRFVRYHADKKQ